MTASPEVKAQLKALVDPRLHRATKMLAVSRGVTISALVQTLLEQELEQVAQATDPSSPHKHPDPSWTPDDGLGYRDGETSQAWRPSK